MPMTRLSLQGILHPHLYSSRSLKVILLDERLEDLKTSGILDRVLPGHDGKIPSQCHDPGTFHGPCNTAQVTDKRLGSTGSYPSPLQTQVFCRTLTSPLRAIQGKATQGEELAINERMLWQTLPVLDLSCAESQLGSEPPRRWEQQRSSCFMSVRVFLKDRLP